MHSHQGQTHHHIHKHITSNMHYLMQLRRKQGFVPLFHHKHHHHNDPLPVKFEKLSISGKELGKARGQSGFQQMYLYGKDEKIFFDKIGTIIGTQELSEKDPDLLPPGKYCFVIVKVNLETGFKYEFRAKIGGTGAHWQLVGDEERDNVVSAGEFFIDSKNKLVFAYNKTGKYQSIPYEQHRDWFVSFFPDGYFAAENFHDFVTQEQINNLLRLRELLHLDHEYGSVARQGVFAGQELVEVVEKELAIPRLP